MNMKSIWPGLTYHVPEEVGHPVDQRADPTNKLQVLGLGHTLLYEVEDKAGRDEGHGENNTDRHHGIYWCGQPEGGGGKSQHRTSCLDKFNKTGKGKETQRLGFFCMFVLNLQTQVKC